MGVSLFYKRYYKKLDYEIGWVCWRTVEE